MSDRSLEAMLRAGLETARGVEPTDAEVRDVLDIIDGERALNALAEGFVLADLLLPDAWQETDVPRCADCGRSLRPHKGHWTCVARCSLYGESQGDGAPEDPS